MGEFIGAARKDWLRAAAAIPYNEIISHPPSVRQNTQREGVEGEEGCHLPLSPSPSSAFLLYRQAARSLFVETEKRMWGRSVCVSTQSKIVALVSFTTPQALAALDPAPLTQGAKDGGGLACRQVTPPTAYRRPPPL